MVDAGDRPFGTGERSRQGGEPSFAKGMLISLAIYTASLPVALIPFVGPPLSVFMVPYLSSAIGTRFAHPRERLPLALTTALIWSSIETVTLLTIMKAAANLAPIGFRIEGYGAAILALMWISNLTFGSLGAIHPWKDPFYRSEDRKDRGPIGP